MTAAVGLSTRRLLAGGAAAGLVLRGLTAVATPAGLVLAARTLDVVEFARFASLLAAGTTVGLLVSLQAREQIARSSAAEVVGTTARLRHLVLAVGGLALAGATLLSVRNPAVTALAVAVALLVVAQPLENLAAGLLVRAGSARGLLLAQGAIPAARLAGFAVLALVGVGTASWFLLAVALSQALPSLLVVVRDRARAELLRATPWSAILAPGLRLTLAMSAVIVIQRSDVALLGVLGNGEAGDYLVVLQILEVPWLLGGAVLTFLIPAVADLGTAERERLLGRLLVGLAAALGIGAVAMAAAVPAAATVVLGRRLEGVTGLTIGLAAGSVVLTGVFVLVGQFTIVARSDSWIAGASGGAALLNLGANAVLIPAFGADGAAGATFGAYAVLVVLLLGRGTRWLRRTAFALGAATSAGVVGWLIAGAVA